MRKQHSFVSPIGLGLLFIFAFILGVDVWQNGGLAFSPGALSATSLGLPVDTSPLTGIKSHADFEKDCGRCHQPLQTVQADLCEKCHIQVAVEILSGTGLHARVEQPSECKTCHPDHAGRSFNIATVALDQFDHTRTSFSLAHHSTNYNSTPLECSACHLENAADFTVDPNTCQTCHKQHDSNIYGATRLRLRGGLFELS